MINNEAIVNEMIELMSSEKYLKEYHKMFEIFGDIIKRSTEEYMETRRYDEEVIAVLSEITEDDYNAIVKRCLLKVVNSL